MGALGHRTGKTSVPGHWELRERAGEGVGLLGRVASGDPSPLCPTLMGCGLYHRFQPMLTGEADISGVPGLPPVLSVERTE